MNRSSAPRSSPSAPGNDRHATHAADPTASQAGEPDSVGGSTDTDSHKGCLVLIALVAVAVAIFVVVIMLFGR